MWFQKIRSYIVLAVLSSSVYHNYAQTPQPLHAQLSAIQLSGPTLYFFEDKTGALAFPGVQQQEFTPVTNRGNSFGMTQSVFWFRFRLKNPLSQPTKRLLEIAYPLLDYIDFYYQQNGQWQLLKMGDLYPFSQRPFESQNFVIPLELHDSQVHTYYIRLKTSSIMQLPLTIYQPNAYQKQHEIEDALSYAQYGILLVMTIYNLLIFFSLRSVPYLHYALSLLFALLFTLVLKGHALQYIWPSAPSFTNSALMLFVGLFNTSFLWYTIYFLNTFKYTPFLTRLLAFSTIVSLFGGLASLINIPLSVYILVPLTLFIMPLMIYTAITCYQRGMIAARFFILAWVLFAIGVILYNLGALDIIPFTFFAQHFIDIGKILAVILLSLALTDRYRYHKREKEIAQTQMLTIQRETNEKLEQKVKERTNELRQKSNEILTQNEALQRHQYQLKQESQKTKDSIQAAQAIQDAILPGAAKLKNLLGDEFFIIYKPKDIVSGDFYWISQITRQFQEDTFEQSNTSYLGQNLPPITLTTKKPVPDEYIYVAVVDCTGHGVPGALMSVMGNALLNEIIGNSKIREPHLILDQLHKKVQMELNQPDTSQIDGGMDMSLCQLEKMANDSTKVTFSGAKSPIYYVCEGVLETLKGDRIAIGSWNKLKPNRKFTSQTIYLQKGNMLYLTTDGFVDTPNVHRKSFGSARLKQLLASIAHLSMSEQKEKLLYTLEKYQKGADQRDDITILGIRIE